MASNNPDITASDIITDVENRLDTPGISTSNYLPWVSYAYQKTFAALLKTNQRVKEELFGNLAEFDLTAGVSEYSLSTNIPRFGGIIKVEIKYGATGDDWVRATKLPSIAAWRVQNNNTTTFRGKTEPVFYQLENIIGFIPIPPATDSGTPMARVWHIRRPYQITSGTDVIDIDYRFIYPIVNYVQARAIEQENEDYSQAALTERKFEGELEMIALAADSEFDENEPNSVVVSTGDAIFSDPFRF